MEGKKDMKIELTTLVSVLFAVLGVTSAIYSKIRKRQTEVLASMLIGWGIDLTKDAPKQLKNSLAKLQVKSLNCKRPSLVEQINILEIIVHRRNSN